MSKNIKKPKIIVILGTTASGKTSLGIKLAKKFKGEIISADSRQVFKGMDIGTGKDLGDYGKGRYKIPYHLIDILDPNEEFNLAKYQQAAHEAIQNILKRGKLPIIVGGTGLYIQALVDAYELAGSAPDPARRKELESKNVEELYKILEGLKKEFAHNLNNSDRHNPRRLIRYIEIIEEGEKTDKKKKENPYEFLLLGVSWPDDILRERINKRLMDRLKEGMILEVEKLQNEGVSWARLNSFGLEYRFVAWYLQEKLSFEEMLEKLQNAIYRFAKRQKTWFKRWEKQGRKIEWVNDIEEAVSLVKKFLQ